MLQQVRSALAIGGIKYLVLKSFHWLLRPFLQFGGVFFHYRDLDWPEPPGKRPRDIWFFLVANEDIDAVMAAQSPDKSRADVAMRLTNGEFCVAGAGPEGGILHTHWFSMRRAEVFEIRKQFLLGSGEAYLYDSWTLPEARGQGVERAASEFTCGWLRQRGVNRIYAYVRSDNVRRLRAIRKHDRLLGVIWYLRRRNRIWFVPGFGDEGVPLRFRKLEPQRSKVGHEIPTRAGSRLGD